MMRFTPLIALSLGHVALAQNITSFSFTPTSSSSTTSMTMTESPEARGFPSTVGDFQFYGCTSGSGFPGFEKVASSQDMSLSFCEASCPGRFFGTFSTDCYCGEDLDDQLTERVDDALCNIECPGNDDEFCGGLAGLPPQVLRRQTEIPIQVLLTLYIRISGGDDDDDNDVTLPPTTVTTTVTSTTTSTITSCPEDYPDCPIGEVTIGVTTIVEEYCPEPTPDYANKKKVIVCYGDFCVPQLPCEADEHCPRHRVVCDDVNGECYPEECPYESEDYSQLVRCSSSSSGEECRYASCSGEECRSKIVCFDGRCSSAECYGDECEKKLVCHGAECAYERCEGEADCYNRYDFNEQDNTYVQAEPCPGTPAPPAAYHPPTTTQQQNVPAAPPAHPPVQNDVPAPAPNHPVVYPCPGEGVECPQGGAQPTGAVRPPYNNNNNNNGTVPMVGDAGKVIPALSLGVVAGIAFFL